MDLLPKCDFSHFNGILHLWVSPSQFPPHMEVLGVKKDDMMEVKEVKEVEMTDVKGEMEVEEKEVKKVKEVRKRKRPLIYLKSLETHWFTHKISILFPSNSLKEKDFTHLLTPFPTSQQENMCYHFTAHLHTLLSPPFLDEVIQQSSFSCLSISLHIDHSNAVAFLPTKKLILTIDKETNELLGLSSHPCSLSKPNHIHCYVVTIDLHPTHFRPGKAIYERVLWAFRNRTEAITFVGVRVKNATLTEMNFPHEVSFRKIPYRKFQKHTKEIPLPLFHPHLFNPDEKLCDDFPSLTSSLVDLHTWMGAIIAGCDSVLQTSPHQPLNEYLSRMALPSACFFSPNYNKDRPSSSSFTSTSLTNSPFTIVSMEGFFPTTHTQQIFQNFQSLIHSQTITWGILLCEGFHDTPVSFADGHHSFSFSGENDLAIFILPKAITHITYVSLCSADSSFGNNG
jgi:ribonucleases P/MRP protein subunit RPP40